MNLQNAWRRIAIVACLLLATTAFAETPRISSISPTSGSTAGGTIVTIKGSGFEFCPVCSPPTPNSVSFGNVPAATIELIDETTLRATAPPHASGTVSITVFATTGGEAATLQNAFTYQGHATTTNERVLLPIFTPPVFGAHGSEFRSEFRMKNASDSNLTLYGFGLAPCPLLCPEIYLQLSRNEEITPGMVEPTGTPGQFLYLAKDQAAQSIMQLRVFDVSRWDTNFGTEIPVVRGDEMRSEPVVLLGVPQTSSFFRNTLRIYATYETTFSVLIEGVDGFSRERFVTLQPGDDIFHPAYGVFTDFPDALGPFRVTVSVVPNEALPPMPPPPDFWAFISVTNNETQHITLISPQR